LPLDTVVAKASHQFPKVMMALRRGSSQEPIAFPDRKPKNRLYRLLDKSRFAHLGPTFADRLKRVFDLQLDAWLQCEEVRFFSFRVHSFAFTKCF